MRTARELSPRTSLSLERPATVIMPVVVANSKLSAATSAHLLLLILWSDVLIPLGTAVRQRYGQSNKCGSALHILAALCALVGLITWVSYAPDNGAVAGAGATSIGSSKTSWNFITVPEILIVGAMIAGICLGQCSNLCCQKISYTSSSSSIWVGLCLTGIVLPLIAFDHLAGSCGGKIVISHKKGYDLYDQMPDDLCTAHFSYATLAAALFLVGVTWHKFAETLSSGQGLADGDLQSGLENIFMCILGTVLLVFRGVTVGAITAGSGAVSLSEGSGGPFFGNTAGLQDGVVWGRVSAAAVCLVVFGVLGCCCHGVRLISGLPVPLGTFALGTALVAVGSSPHDTYFGHSATYDASLAQMQATFLLSAGLLAILASVARLVAAWLGCCCASSSVAGSRTRNDAGNLGTASRYYALSVAGVSILACGGFLLLAQPATTQLLGRDLNISGKGGATCVIFGSIIVHMLLRSLLAMIPVDDVNRQIVRSPDRLRRESGFRTQEIEITGNSLYADDASDLDSDDSENKMPKSATSPRVSYLDDASDEEDIYENDVDAV